MKNIKSAYQFHLCLLSILSKPLLAGTTEGVFTSLTAIQAHWDCIELTTNLEEVMDALHIDHRVVLRTFLDRPEDIHVVDQFALQDRGNLRPLGHNVVEQHFVFLRRCKRFFQLVEIRRIDDHRLIGEYVKPSSNGFLNIVCFQPVIARHYDDVA